MEDEIYNKTANLSPSDLEDLEEKMASSHSTSEKKSNILEENELNFEVAQMNTMQINEKDVSLLEGEDFTNQKNTAMADDMPEGFSPAHYRRINSYFQT